MLVVKNPPANAGGTKWNIQEYCQGTEDSETDVYGSD